MAPQRGRVTQGERQVGSTPALALRCAPSVAMGMLLGYGWHAIGEASVRRGSPSSLGYCIVGILLGMAGGAVLVSKATRHSLFWIACLLNGGLLLVAQVRDVSASDAALANALLSSLLLGGALSHMLPDVLKQLEAEIVLPLLLSMLLTESACGMERLPALRLVVAFGLLLAGFGGLLFHPGKSSVISKSVNGRAGTASGVEPGSAVEPFFPSTALDARRYSPNFLVSRRPVSMQEAASATPLVNVVPRQASTDPRGGGRGKDRVSRGGAAMPSRSEQRASRGVSTSTGGDTRPTGNEEAETLLTEVALETNGDADQASGRELTGNAAEQDASDRCIQSEQLGDAHECRGAEVDDDAADYSADNPIQNQPHGLELKQVGNQDKDVDYAYAGDHNGYSYGLDASRMAEGGGVSDQRDSSDGGWSFTAENLEMPVSVDGVPPVVGAEWTFASDEHETPVIVQQAATTSDGFSLSAQAAAFVPGEGAAAGWFPSDAESPYVGDSGFVGYAGADLDYGHPALWADNSEVTWTGDAAACGEDAWWSHGDRWDADGCAGAEGTYAEANASTSCPNGADDLGMSNGSSREGAQATCVASLVDPEAPDPGIGRASAVRRGDAAAADDAWGNKDGDWKDWSQSSSSWRGDGRKSRGRNPDASNGSHEQASESETPKWAYIDPHGQVRKAFSTEKMKEWYDHGYFKADLKVALSYNGETPSRRAFYPLQQWFRARSTTFTYIPKF